MIRFVFLDIDDTFFDFAWQEDQGLHRAYAELGIPLPDDMFARYHEINQLWWEKHERGEVSRDELVLARHRQLFEEFGLDADPAAVETSYRRYLGIGYRFLPHAEEILHYLRPKYRLYVASNGVASTQYSRLESAGLLDFFDGIFISEELGAIKPSAEFFERAFAQIPGFRADEAILIGDSISSDILGGMRAGMKTVWYNSRKRPPVEGIRPDYTIDSLLELREIL